MSLMIYLMLFPIAVVLLAGVIMAIQYLREWIKINRDGY